MASSHPVDPATYVKHGRLTIVRKHNFPNGIRAECICECGNRINLKYCRILNGRVSCGCYWRELCVAFGEQYRMRQLKHGRCTSKIYRVYQSILYNRHRGAIVCERWSGPNGFANFLADMGEWPQKTVLVRIDNNGQYEPSNCRWGAVKENYRTRESNRLITHDGKTQSLTQWAEDGGMSHQKLDGRLKLGWPLAEALSPAKRKRPVKT